MTKIGILIQDFEKLDNWELRIIEEIKNNPSLELRLLIKEGRNEIKVPKKKNVIGRLLFEIQKKIRLYNSLFRRDAMLRVSLR
ncbi:MAG: hypothetical protein VSS75_030910 [Candidatus Parabeggiatoa sp.]|nr:hypothetical protein [Candidatus Parabeggiatoa sp.]